MSLTELIMTDDRLVSLRKRLSFDDMATLDKVVREQTQHPAHESGALHPAIAPREERGDEMAAFEMSLSPTANVARSASGAYENEHVQAKWIGWQARSRLSAQVGADEPIHTCETRSYCDACDAAASGGADE